jgi:hypothetical protein
VDEITIHPRDNAMILATHGRAIWILDHLEPIQEYAAAQAAATADAKLFTPPPYAMYRRPARDHNYEFWGDQVFYGENPPQAAIISWINKRQVGDLKLRITDAGGREVREISGRVLANSTKPGIQAACWDLRVQPAPALPRAGGPGEAGRTGGAGRAGGGGQATEEREESPFGAGCPATGGIGGGGFGFGGPNVNGPFVLNGVYNVSLIVDGKTVDTKPLRVNDDPDVLLTSVERKRNYDMAMEMHALQAHVTDAAAAHASLTRQMTDLEKTLADRSDVPADVKASFDAVKKDLGALAPKLMVPQGGRGGGGGRGAAADSLLVKIGQAKNGLTGGMPPGDQTTRAYTDAKAQAPKAIADLNAAIAKASTLSTALQKYSLTLTVPAAVKTTDAAPAKRSSSQR